ncbi:hypothetical protein [Streptomyces sp. XH2]
MTRIASPVRVFRCRVTVALLIRPKTNCRTERDYAFLRSDVMGRIAAV